MSFVSDSSPLLPADKEKEVFSGLVRHKRESVLSRCNSIAGQQPITLTWNNINVYAKPEKPNSLLNFGKAARTNEIVNDGGRGKQILRNVSGIAKPGQCIAVMGASGAGKSTLINTLTGRNSGGVIIEGGDVCVNGRPIGRDMTNLCAYVQQNDLFYGTFTALLRLPSSMSRADKIERVDEVIIDLGLSKCADTTIGLPGLLQGISGGEKKRLAFASEVLTNPSLLFCDEPTTGLDSFMAEGIVTVLQKLAKRGKTIMCTIHQPASEIFTMFDTLLLIADGRIAYMGDREGALKLFQSLGAPCPSDYNPADYFIEKLSIVDGDANSHAAVMRICDAFEVGDVAKEVDKEIDAQEMGTGNMDDDALDGSPYKALFVVQLAMLLWRATIGNFRNKRVAMARYMQKAVMGIMVGLLYWQTEINQSGIQNVNGVFFYFIATMSYPAMYGVVDTVHKEFAIVVREHHSGMYTVLAFYVSRVVSFIPIYPIDGLLMTLICYFMIGLRASFSAFLLMWVVVICIELAAVSIGLMFAAVSPTYPIALALSAPVTTVISLTGGIYANVGTLPVWISWTQWLSYFRFSFEAFLINQWVPVEHIECRSNSTSACLPSGEAVLSSLNFESDFGTYWRNIGAMLLMTFVCHLIGYIGLAIRVKRAR